MGRQRNNPQSKGKEEYSEKVLSEIEASQLSDNWVQNSGYEEAQWRQWESPKTTGKLWGTYYQLYQHEEIQRNNQQEPRGNEEHISELKNIAEGIKIRLDEAEDWISELQDKVEKSSQEE